MPTPEVSRYMRAFDREEAVERLRRDDADWREHGHGMFAMLANDGTGFLGRVSLKYWPQFDEAEVGWVLRRDAWGHGYATRPLERAPPGALRSSTIRT
jgi:RimJ/RimL family protein N-acetyltransferase